METATNGYQRVTPQAKEAIINRLRLAGVVLDPQGRPKGADYDYILKMSGDQVHERVRQQREERKKIPDIIILGPEGSGGGRSSSKREARKTPREIDEYLKENRDKLSRYLVFYVSGDLLGQTTGGSTNEIEIENALKKMGYEVQDLNASELISLGKNIYDSAAGFLKTIGLEYDESNVIQMMYLAQSKWLDAMTRIGERWAGEIYEAREHLSTPEMANEYQKAIGRHLQSRIVPDSVKDALKVEYARLRDGEVANIRTTEEALDFLRLLASQQTLKGVEALNAEVYSAQFGAKARDILFRKFPELEKIFRAELELKEAINKVSTEWKKLGDNAHALFRSFVDDKDKIQPRSMPDLSLGKLGTLFELKISFGERSYGQLVSNALKFTLEEIETADREITAGVSRSSKNPYTDQMDAAMTREYFDKMAVRIANCGDNFGVDPELNKEEFGKRKAVAMDAIGMARGLISVFGLAGRGNLYFSTYTEGDQLARLMNFRRGVDADRETNIERKVGASSAILKADKDGKFALRWLKMGMTYPEFVDVQNKTTGAPGVLLKDGSTSKMVDIVRSGNFHKIDWSRNNIIFEKYLDYLGRAYSVYQLLVEKNPKPDIVSTKMGIKDIKKACVGLVEENYPSESPERKAAAANDLAYQIFRVVISAHNPLDDDVPNAQWWTDGDYTAALENIRMANILPAKELSMLEAIVADRFKIVIKTPTGIKQVVSIDH